MLTDPPWDVPRLIWVLVLEPRWRPDRSSQVVTQASEQEIRWLPAGVDDVVPHPGSGNQEVSDLITTRWLSVGDWPRVGPGRTPDISSPPASGLWSGQQVRRRGRVLCTPAPPQSVPAHQREPQLRGRERVRHRSPSEPSVRAARAASLARPIPTCSCLVDSSVDTSSARGSRLDEIVRRRQAQVSDVHGLEVRRGTVGDSDHVGGGRELRQRSAAPSSLRESRV